MIMNTEIERKFLVTDGYKADIQASFEIKQGYLNSNPERTVRIRTKGEKAFLTIKGLSEMGGLKRFEWEKELTLDEIQPLFDLCEDFIIHKTRHIIVYQGHTWEIDEFWGKHKGLVLAEVEMKSVDEDVALPDWIIKEVTGDRKYYNSSLCKNDWKG